MLKTQFYKNLEKKIMVFVLDSIRVQFCIWFNWFQKSVCVLKSCSDNLRTESILRAVQLTLFLAFDEDGDGFLNLEQVYQAIHSLGKVWPMKDIREALPKDCKEVDFPGKIFLKAEKCGRLESRRSESGRSAVSLFGFEVNSI